MEAGDTFRRSYGSHLWVVVSDPGRDPNRLLIVNLTTVRSSCDPACILNAGDHPFVKHPSYLLYAESRIVTSAELDQKVAAGQIILEPKMRGDVLARIRQGAAISNYIPLQNRKLLEDQGLISTDDLNHNTLE